MSDDIDFILKRRSIRKFEDRPVEQEKIITLLKAGMAAPSAMNSQPWEFVVVTEALLLERLRGISVHGKMVSPVIIVVLGSPKVARHAAGETYWIQDCSAVIENILLAAANTGLGSVWVGVYPRQEKITAVREILNIPADVIPLAMVYIGYPQEDKAPHTKFRKERIHWQRYLIEKRDLPQPVHNQADPVIKRA